jgi:hypothetical protein
MEICFGESRCWLLVLHLSHLKRQMGKRDGKLVVPKGNSLMFRADYVLDGGTVVHINFMCLIYKSH